jgi:diguanylate cyclase (GGDEF)-like protein
MHPLCEAVQASPVSRLRCDLSCRGFVANAFKDKAQKILKCSAQVVNFILPVEYHGTWAAILGQGSFSGYDDTNIFIDPHYSPLFPNTALTMPPTFTSMVQARSVCSLLESSVAERLRTSQENVSLHRRIESLQSVLEHWTASALNDPETLNLQLIKNLTAFLDGRSLSLLVQDGIDGVFIANKTKVSAQGLSAPASIRMQDQLLQRLLTGEPYVMVEGKASTRKGDGGGEGGGFTLCPVMVNGRIESLLVIADPVPNENDLQIITAFCRQTGLAIENHRQHQELYRKFDQLEAVTKLNEVIVPIENEHVLLQTILEKSADLLLAEQGSLMLLDHETDALFLEATKGIAAGAMGKIRVARGEGIAGRVAELGEPLLCENIEEDPRIGQKSRARYKTSSFVSVPLKIRERIMGVMNLADKTTGGAFNEEDLHIAEALAAHAAIALERNTLHEQMDKLKKLSITDSLTGLLNRRYMFDRLEEELSRSHRYNRPLSVLMLDLDGFKQYNDNLGHPTGDRILETVALAIMSSVRTMDIVGRYGGDEFMIILPETGVATALHICERLTSEVAKTILPTGGSDRVQKTISASIGVACFPEHEGTAGRLLECADIALYRAKAVGKNRIEVYTGPDRTS